MFAVEQKNDIEILRMQYGPANAMDLDFCTELTRTVRTLENSPARAILLTGQDRIFSAGVDLPQLLEGGVSYIRAFLPALNELFATLFFCAKPVVAAVNGHAIAGGCILSCCCDRRIMAAGKGRVGVPELQIGVPFPTVIMEIMRARTQPFYFDEVILGGASYSPADALQRGLIDAMVEPEALLSEALAAAAALAAIRPEVFAFAKRQTRVPVQEAIAARSAAQEAEINRLWEADATRDAITAFVARTLKRKKEA